MGLISEKGKDHTEHCSVGACRLPVLGDTEAWRQPLCLAHYIVFGEPAFEPRWEQVIEVVRATPRVFAWRNTAAGAVGVMKQPAIGG
jgi:hypothetical protein